jgi:hypothetical protein
MLANLTLIVDMEVLTFYSDVKNSDDLQITKNEWFQKKFRDCTKPFVLLIRESLYLKITWMKYKKIILWVMNE